MTFLHPNVPITVCMTASDQPRDPIGRFGRTVGTRPDLTVLDAAPPRTVDDWQKAVAAGNTSLGFDDWACEPVSVDDAIASLDPDDADAWEQLESNVGANIAVQMFNEANGDIAAMRRFPPDTAKFLAANVPFDRHQKMRDHGVSPDDFESPNENTRQYASYLRGDLVFEGRLTSEALRLDRHSTNPAMLGRNVAMPHGVKGHGLDIESSYIDGYASAAECIASLRQRGDVDWSTAALRDRGWQFPHPQGQPDSDETRKARRRGFLDAYVAAEFDDQMRSDTHDTTSGVATIVDSDNAWGEVPVTDIEPAPDGKAWRGRVAESGHARFNSDGETKPWTTGSRIWFASDQVKDFTTNPGA